MLSPLQTRLPERSAAPTPKDCPMGLLLHTRAMTLTVVYPVGRPNGPTHSTIHIFPQEPRDVDSVGQGYEVIKPEHDGLPLQATANKTYQPLAFGSVPLRFVSFVSTARFALPASRPRPSRGPKRAKMP